ncbi:MAG: hypothetical protein M3Y27_12640, partial [Acidobacteriota bacterium]|nr:hypothetical protein [Acidobacteriota bacterium]
ATINPSTATGKVTFYDRSSILGVGLISSGEATLTTNQLSPGSCSLGTEMELSGHTSTTLREPSLSR